MNTPRPIRLTLHHALAVQLFLGVMFVAAGATRLGAPALATPALWLPWLPTDWIGALGVLEIVSGVALVAPSALRMPAGLTFAVATVLFGFLTVAGLAHAAQGDSNGAAQLVYLAAVTGFVAWGQGRLATRGPLDTNPRLHLDATASK